MKLEFSRQIFEKYSIFLKIFPVGAELFLAYGRTDRSTDRHDESKSRFWQFCERKESNDLRIFIWNVLSL